ncbi:MAG TPA: sigma-70 family RNA polymerase sigma factor [Candidatus Dormibacteraeota bacterium]
MTEAFPGEAALVERARSDPEAFGQLYEHYAPLVYRFFYNRLRDRSVAEDLTAEVFYKALRAIDRYRPSGSPFRAWLFQIAVNTRIDHLRGRRSGVELDAAGEQADPSRSVEEQVAQRAEVERVWDAVRRLNEAQRTAITLKLGLDLHTAEIAIAMGRSEGAVKLLINRGLATVRKRLDDARRAQKEAG